MLQVIHINDNTQFCFLVNPGIRCSPNNRLIADCGFIFVSLIVQDLRITTFHLLSIFTVCSPYRYMFISSLDYPKCKQTLSYQMIVFTIITLIDYCYRYWLELWRFVIMGLKSSLSCLAWGALVILMLQIICSSRFALTDNFIHFLLIHNLIRSV
jgi:hypothetical protein